jgi:hypothetical protein
MHILIIANFGYEVRRIITCGHSLYHQSC